MVNSIADIAYLDGLVKRIHEATGDEDRWSATVDEVRSQFDAALAVVERHHFSSGQAAWLYHAPKNESLAADYLSQFSLRNPWFISSSPYTQGKILTDDQLVHPEQLIASDFFLQFLKPLNLRYRLCGVITRADDSVCHFAIYRSPDQGEFTESQKDLLSRILPHLTLALNTHWELAQAQGYQGVFRTMINHFSHASFIVDCAGQVLHCNDPARQLLKKFSGLLIDRGRIRAMNAVENRRLKAALATIAQWPEDDQLNTSTQILTLERARGELPIILTLRLIGNVFNPSSGKVHRLAFIAAKDPSESAPPHTCSFAKLYELTPAQSRLSALMFSGYSLAAAAQRLHVSENTARSHLKQIFLKTDTHGQMELVQLHERVCDDNF